MTFTIDPKGFFLLSIVFIVTLIVGTISHEWGHYITARMLGFKAHISYNATWLIGDYEALNIKQYFLFTVAGPLQTMLTGTLGFAYLNYSAKFFKTTIF